MTPHDCRLKVQTVDTPPQMAAHTQRVSEIRSNNEPAVAASEPVQRVVNRQQMILRFSGLNQMKR